MYLVTQGVNPKDHGIKQELVRENQDYHSLAGMFWAQYYLVEWTCGYNNAFTMDVHTIRPMHFKT